MQREWVIQSLEYRIERLFQIYKNMDNNQSWEIKQKKEQMQNWKKQILMDPILNVLFDKNVSAEDFVLKKLMTLTQSQIVAIYPKLTTIHFQLLQGLQKEVETKSTLIQKSYSEVIAYKQQLENQEQGQQMEDKNRLNKGGKNVHMENLQYLKNYNTKYQAVQQSLTFWKNIRECLRFGKSFQTYKVNINLLKNLMRGYTGNEESINAIKISKIIRDISLIIAQFDFSGIKTYQNQRAFLTATKSTIHSIGAKTLTKLLQQYATLNQSEKVQKQSINKNIQDWVNGFQNLGTLKDFVINYGKSLLQNLSDSIKKNFKSEAVPNLATYLQNNFIPSTFQTCKALILLQEKLVLMRKVQLSGVPNLFIRFWQKLCDILRQNLVFPKLDRNLKQRQETIVWKYPTIYWNFSNLCSNIQVFLLENSIYNNYNFSKYKQRLMVVSLAELGINYHQEKDKKISEIKNLIEKSREKNREQSLEQKTLVVQKLKSQLDKWIANISTMFEQSKCSIIFDSILNRIGENLKVQSQKNQAQSEELFNLVYQTKKQLKKVLAKLATPYGVTKNQLQIFKV